MKHLINFCILFLISFLSLGQTFSGISEIESAKKEGFYTYINAAEEDVTESWKKYLNEFGNVEKGRNGAIISNNTKVKSISENEFTVLSKITEEKNRVRLFIAIPLGTDNYIKSGHPSYREASIWLDNFVKLAQLEEAARLEEKKLNELIKTKTKNQRYAERLVRELEANKRQTDLLNLRLDEAKLAKEKILANQVQNQLDLKSSEDSVVIQGQKLETAKQKLKK
ncbi:hypothetical protein V7S76_12870 [Aquirufa sp. ROCK2-A2]